VIEGRRGIVVLYGREKHAVTAALRDRLPEGTVIPSRPNPGQTEKRAAGERDSAPTDH
jgi:hypothetical protein